MRKSKVDRWLRASRQRLFSTSTSFFHQPSPSKRKSTKTTTQGYREDAGLFLESDTDEQLLINIPFTQGEKGGREKRHLGSPSLRSLPLSLFARFAHTSRNQKKLTPFSQQPSSSPPSPSRPPTPTPRPEKSASSSTGPRSASPRPSPTRRRPSSS